MHAHDSTDTRQEKVDLGAELGMEIEEVKKQPPLGLRRKKRPDIGAGRPVPGVANKSRPATLHAKTAGVLTFKRKSRTGVSARLHRALVSASFRS